MKKVLFLLICIIGLFGCNQSGVVSINAVKKALDIAYTETKSLKWRDEYFAEIIQGYLQGQKYHNNMECRVLDLSDVDGAKYLRACFLEGVNTDDRASTKDILVMAVQSNTNKDVIVLMFFRDARKINQGFIYNTLSAGISVNLKTQKIGQM